MFHTTTSRSKAFTSTSVSRGAEHDAVGRVLRIQSVRLVVRDQPQHADQKLAGSPLACKLMYAQSISPLGSNHCPVGDDCTLGHDHQPFAGHPILALRVWPVGQVTDVYTPADARILVDDGAFDG
jgi:hypothetical protein